MGKVVTEYDGVKLALQPYGLKSRLLVAFAAFVVAFGGALAVVNPAQAAVSPTRIDSCLDGWFWKAGTGEKELPPSVTSSGMVFNDQDTVNAVLAWYGVDLLPPSSLDSVTGGKWSMATLDGTPGVNSAFKLLTSPWTGTWNYSGGDSWWTSGYTANGVASGDYTTEAAKTAIAGASAGVIAFGLGTETASIDGPWTASELRFAGSIYRLRCVPGTIEVPGPVVTITETMTASPMPVETVTQFVTPTPSPSTTVKPSATPSKTSTLAAIPPPVGGINSTPAGKEESLVPWGVAVAGTTGLVLVAVGAWGIISRRRRHLARHAAYEEDETQMIPTYHGGDGYSGQSLDESSTDATMVMPLVPDETPPDSSGARPLPPA